MQSMYTTAHQAVSMWHRGSKPVACRFWLSYSVIFHTASASKYSLYNQNILFLTEVILVSLEHSKREKIE